MCWFVCIVLVHFNSVTTATGKTPTVNPTRPTTFQPPGKDESKPLPVLASLKDLLTEWPADQPTPSAPCTGASSIPRLDWRDAQDRGFAHQFRLAGVPFVLEKVPRVERLPSVWTPERMALAAGSSLFSVTILEGVDYAYTLSEPESRIDEESTYSVTHSRTNSPTLAGSPTHAAAYTSMHTTAPRSSPSRSPGGGPTAAQRMILNWTEFEKKLHQQQRQDGPHYYLQFNPMEPRPEWTRGLFSLERDLDNEFAQAASDGSRLWGCKFGADIRSRAHFDNAALNVVVLRGLKRWLLIPPSECNKLSLIKQGEFSRQTFLNWTDPSVIDTFSSVRALDVVLGEKELLFVPQFWLHYVIAIGTAWQCTLFDFTSGLAGDADIARCGFPDWHPMYADAQR